MLSSGGGEGRVLPKASKPGDSGLFWFLQAGGASSFGKNLILTFFTNCINFS